MLEIVNQLDGFDSRGNIKVQLLLFPRLSLIIRSAISLCQPQFQQSG